MTAVMTDRPILPAVPTPAALPDFLEALRALDMTRLPEDFDLRTRYALSLRQRDWSADRWAVEQAYLVYDLEAVARGETDGAMRNGEQWDGTTRDAERIRDALSTGPVLIDPPQPFVAPFEEFGRVLGCGRTPERPWAVERWLWADHQRALHKSARDAGPQLRRAHVGWSQHAESLAPAAALEADRFAGRVRARLADALAQQSTRAASAANTSRRNARWV